LPFLLRKVRKNRWYKNLEEYPWLSQGELPADPLGDLATQDCALSVWFIDDEKSNLERVIVALAATTESLSNFDFALFDMPTLEAAGFILEPTPGETPASIVNQWHRDVIRISATNLARLAHAVWPTVQTERRSKLQLKEMIADGVKTKLLDPAKVNKKILGELGLTSED
jgi:hypothetical protein